MKELIPKIIQIFTLIVASCIVLYGIVNVQQVCCSTSLDACIPASNTISFDNGSANTWTTSQSYNCNNQGQSILCYKHFLADFDSENTCCVTDHCGGYSQSEDISLSIVQKFYPLKRNVNSIHACKGGQTKHEPYRLPTSLKVVSIYLDTQSIIC